MPESIHLCNYPEYNKKYVDEVVTVNDEEIANALYLLLQRAKLVVEPAGAVALAAVLSKKSKLSWKKCCSGIKWRECKSIFTNSNNRKRNYSSARSIRSQV
jgi:threonine dehydratase